MTRWASAARPLICFLRSVAPGRNEYSSPIPTARARARSASVSRSNNGAGLHEESITDEPRDRSADAPPMKPQRAFGKSGCQLPGISMEEAAAGIQHARSDRFGGER